MKKTYLLRLAILSVTLASAMTAVAQGDASRTVTAADYARAERLMGYNTNPLVSHSGVRPNWLADERFWYRITTNEGSEFVLVDPARGTRGPAFDHAKLAVALSTAAGATYDANHLPFTDLEFSADGQSITFAVRGSRWKCDVQGSQCSAAAAATTGQPGGQRGPGRGGARLDITSPDKKRTAFIRDYNLWVRDLPGGKETQLTTDGVRDFGYATDNAGWVHSERAVLSWSPDSKKIATFQQDQRGVGEMYLVDTKVGHPTMQAWKYPLPGDDVITTIQRVIVEVDTPKVIRIQLPADQHRSTLCDDVQCRGGEWADVEWSADSNQLAFVSTSRDHKNEQLRIADARTGAIREVMEEKAATQFESGWGLVNWHYLSASNEVIWFSERDNWGHLYLYDTATGKLKNQITSGDWVVTELIKVDEKSRTLYFYGMGREKGNPYFAHLYRVGFDGKGMTLLTPDNGNHGIAFSPSGRFFVDSYSSPDTAEVAVLRDANGKLIVPLEKADISRLVATGWKPPVPITVKARDGETDLYGLMFKPTNLDPNRKYPLVNHIYPGPQGGSVGSWSFLSARGDAQALAELGFIVVEIEGMGNPLRSKKFHDAYFGNLGDNTLPDQIAAMKELAAKNSWIDLDRAGIYGHSGGGFATAGAMFRYPDFFKVGISESGNHDNREYEDDWGERYQGLLVKKSDGTSNYDDQANQSLAKNLKGHLLLAHGTMDDNVPMNNTLLVVDALIKANKDFDLLLLPNQRHGYGSASNYMTRRRWDYFVRYLLGVEPPKNYELHPPDVRPAP